MKLVLYASRGVILNLIVCTSCFARGVCFTEEKIDIEFVKMYPCEFDGKLNRPFLHSVHEFVPFTGKLSKIIRQSSYVVSDASKCVSVQSIMFYVN